MECKSTNIPQDGKSAQIKTGLRGGEKYRWGYGTWDIGKTKSDVEKIMSDVEKTTSDIIFALAGF